MLAGHIGLGFDYHRPYVKIARPTSLDRSASTAAFMLAGHIGFIFDLGNPVGDRGLAELMAPPLTAALMQLEVLNIDRTQAP